MTIILILYIYIYGSLVTMIVLMQKCKKQNFHSVRGIVPLLPDQLFECYIRLILFLRLSKCSIQSKRQCFYSLIQPSSVGLTCRATKRGVARKRERKVFEFVQKTPVTLSQCCCEALETENGQALSLVALWSRFKLAKSRGRGNDFSLKEWFKFWQWLSDGYPGERSGWSRI